MKFAWKTGNGRVFDEVEIQKLLELLSDQFEKAYIVGNEKPNGKPLVITTVFQWTGPHDYCEFSFEPNCSQFTVTRPPILTESTQKIEAALKSAGYI